MHTLTVPELQRIVDASPGNEALADLLAQLTDVYDEETVVRVDLTALLKKSD